ncbi:MAG TPA: hypothetical protein VJ719_14025 [Chthoniobacterales bacterium]|nr:hypothetical protein [Chthoniobacterales bacterium]
MLVNTAVLIDGELSVMPIELALPSATALGSADSRRSPISRSKLISPMMATMNLLEIRIGGKLWIRWPGKVKQNRDREGRVAG